LKARDKPIFNMCRLNRWRTFCEGFEMASPGSVYHPEQEIELMTAALDDAVVLANGQRSSAVKVLSNYEYPHSWALPDDDC
jgi:hypothetical protein